MDDKIYQCQQRLFYKLFATLPITMKVDDFTKGLDLDFNVLSFNFFRNKDFWFTRVEKNDKFYFLFGLVDKEINNISGRDICLIIDFDMNIQFNDVCLGLFGFKNSDIHVFINYRILKERYPHINVSDFRKRKFKSFDDSIDVEVIDLGGLNSDCIDNIEKLVKLASKSKALNIAVSEKLDDDTGTCKICLKKKDNFFSDLNFDDLRSIRPELCEKCIEKIVASEFYTKILPLLDGNNAGDINLAKKKFGNDQLFDMGLKLLKKYELIHFIGVRNLFYSIDKDSYIVKKYLEYSDSNNLLIDNISKINEENKVVEEKSDTIDVKNDSNSESSIKNEIEDYEKKEINRNVFLEHFKAGKTKKESAKRAHIALSIIEEWYEKGSNNKQPYVDFYNKYVDVENNKKSSIPCVIKTDSFGNKNIVSKMNIILEDLVNGQTEDEAIAHANISKNTYDYWITRGKHDFGDLYVQFYNYIKEFKSKNYDSEINERRNGQELTLPTGIYEPLLPEYEALFTSMNTSGIAWVNEIDGMWSYSRNIGGKKINLTANNIPELYEKVTNQDLIWGIRDYGRAKEFINFPEDFEIPLGSEIEDIGDKSIDEVDSDIYAPLPEKFEESFAHTSMNKTGIAWVNKVGNNWVYQRQKNGKKLRIEDSNIVKLHEKVVNNNQIWGITDIDKARIVIETNSIHISEPKKIEKPPISKSQVTVNYIEKSVNDFEILIKGVINNKDLFNVLNRFDSFKENIKRVVITSINKQSDIFIELELNKYSLRSFEEKLEDLGWKINK